MSLRHEDAEYELDRRFTFLDHTADVYIAAYGRTLEEAFSNAGIAFFEVMTDTKKVERKVRKYIKVEGFDYFSLLYNWLEELLFIFEAKGLVFSHIEVKEIQKISESKIILEAVAEGENFDPQRHESRTLVKAVTYSLMDISKRDDGTYVVKFVLDI